MMKIVRNVLIYIVLSIFITLLKCSLDVGWNAWDKGKLNENTTEFSYKLNKVFECEILSISQWLEEKSWN